MMIELQPSGSVAVDCIDLDANLRFFVDEFHFRVQLVTPADAPRRIVIERCGFRLELRRADVDIPVTVVLDVPGAGLSNDAAADVRRAPNGSEVIVRRHQLDPVIPEAMPSLVVTTADAGSFGTGRAGMEYRDLLPDRWGGRFIASHIKIADGGDVADWVHYHRIRFQMIFVAAGWVDLVYEDQGEPFRLHAGDCVLQPPEIRHRVLRSSPGLEVIEIGCPAEHDTLADHDLELPTADVRPDRDFGGQRFVRHIAADNPTTPWIVDGLRFRDTGIGAATNGLAGAVVVSSDRDDSALRTDPLTHHDEFVMCVGLAGRATLDIDGVGAAAVAPRTSVAVPPASSWSWRDVTADHECLIVSLGAQAIQHDR